MRTTEIVTLVAVVLLGGCTTTVSPTIDDVRPVEHHYEILDDTEVLLLEAEEDWCTTLEGSAGAWLAANDHDLIVDVSSGEPGSLEPETVALLETVASGGSPSVSPDDIEELDTFLRFPIPSPLACRTAFETRDR